MDPQTANVSIIFHLGIEVAFLFLAITSTIIFPQFGSYITSLFGALFISSNIFLEHLSCCRFGASYQKDVTKCETWSLDRRSLCFKTQKNETIK